MFCSSCGNKFNEGNKCLLCGGVVTSQTIEQQIDTQPKQEAQQTGDIADKIDTAVDVAIGTSLIASIFDILD